MTYKEWAKEYSDSALLLNEKIHNLTLSKKTAPPKMLKELDGRIQILRQMYYECRNTADILYNRRGVAF